MRKFDLVATCSLGLEAVVARELKALEFEDVRAENGSVCFTGGSREIARANMWLRSADRLWLKLASFPCATFEDLFQGVKEVPWKRYLTNDACFPVEAHSHNSRLDSLPAIQRTAKKALVECMQEMAGTQWLPENGPQFPLKVFLDRDECTLMLDTSGSGLHRRGYHTMNAAAPLRETLAAALVQLSYWNKDRLLVDPFCGSGTIAIEAAMIGLKRAPGLRRHFVSEEWPFMGEKVWREAREEAEDLFDRTTKLSIVGSDIDPKVLELARFHLRQSGLEDRGISFQCKDIRDFRTSKRYGVMITNPPYGERMLDRRQAEELYYILGDICYELDTWSLYIISGHPDFAHYFGLKVDRKRKVYNGLMPCVYYQLPGPKPPERH